MQCESGSENGELINNLIKDGKIVPVSITCGLIKKAMEQAGWEKRKYLVDGFPRNYDNYTGWEEAMGKIVNVPFAFYFDVNCDILTERILERAKTSGRNDDNIDTLKKRFATFENDSIPVINKFGEAGKLYKIDGARSIDEVYEDVKRSLAGYI